MKPRIHFCWWCGNKLWNDIHIEIEVDGFPRIMHKACNEERLREEEYEQINKYRKEEANEIY